VNEREHAWRDYQGEYRVLIIEDDKDDQFMLRRIFERHGYLVVAATTGEEGLEKCWGDHFSVVLVNLKLSPTGMNGIAVIEAIYLRAPHIPVVIVTGYDYPTLAYEADRLKVLMTVKKPFTDADFRNMLLKLKLPHRANGYANGTAPTPA